MRPETIKILDKNVGKILCFLFTIINKLSNLFKPERNAKIVVKKILFIKLIEQGASVLAYNALKRAVDRVGSQNVFFLVFIENTPILEILKIIPAENILTIRNNKCFFVDVIRRLRKIKQLHVDTAIDMEFFSRASALIAYCSGAQNRVGYHRYTSELPYRGDLMTHKIQYNPYIHVSLAYYLLVEALNFEKTEIPMLKINVDDIRLKPNYYLPETVEIEEVKTKIIQNSNVVLLRPIIIMNPNSTDLMPLRKWDESNFIELAKKIITYYNNKLTIILTGNCSDITSAEIICNTINSERVVDLTGKTTLRELMALYSFADALITSDSGPGHFASMTKIKDIVLFGPETSALYGPLGLNVHCIEASLSCRPCINAFNHRFSPCENSRCMKSISVQTVFNKLVEQ